MQVVMQIEGLKRDEAYTRIVAFSHINRGKHVHVDTLFDGRRIFLSFTGMKSPYDFTVHVNSERQWVKYFDDFILDIKKKGMVQPSIIAHLIRALEASAKLHKIDKIYQDYPSLIPSKTHDLPGHSIDYLLRIIRWLGLQEDVNYWGPSFDGRMKPIIALREYFIDTDQAEEVLLKHKIIYQ